MANDCSRLMKETLDNYLGIDMRYKLDDTLASLGKQKFSAKQLEGYLLKKGVSPKEIKQSGIFEGMEADNRAISADDWLGMSGNQQLFKEEKMGIDTLYSDITLSREGMQDTNKYTETISTIKSPKENEPFPFHFNPPKSESILGWRRTHVQDIDGKKTLVLNELQSDWAQTERARRGIFESSINSPKLQEQFKEASATIEKYKLEFFDNLRQQEQNKNLPLQDIEDKYWDDWMEYRLGTGPEELIQAGVVAGGKVNQDIVADFPMAEIKHNQFQIVGAIDDALKQGIDTIAIPIQREGADLQGKPGVTKFYESLNKKVLPEIRSKLEKQGMRIKVDKTPYSKEIKVTPGMLNRVDIDSIINRLYDTGAQENLIDSEMDNIFAYLSEGIDFGLPNTLKNNIDESLNFLQKDLSNYNNTNNELWKLTVEEIPNKPVKWDVYGLIGALGLSSMLAGEANAEELKPSQVSISPKTNQQTQQQPQPIIEQMTTQPEVIEQPRQQMDEGFSLRKLLESDKLAPEVDEQSTASLFEQLGLVKKDDLGNYRVNKDIDEDSKVDMRKQMPKTIQDQEGEYLTTHRPTKKSGWTIGRGYDSTGRKLQDIINDFAKAGISQQKAIAFFKHKPISINSTQSKALGDIAWQEKVKVAKSIGLPMEELDKDGFLKVMSLVYRGDIVKGGDGYRGRLYNYAKNGNIKAIDRFINTEARNMEGGSVLYNRWKKFN